MYNKICNKSKQIYKYIIYGNSMTREIGIYIRPFHWTFCIRKVMHSIKIKFGPITVWMFY